MLGRLMADHEHFKRITKADGDETRALLNDISLRLAALEEIAPTNREKAFVKWLIGIVVMAILARFGIDASSMPSP